MNCLTDQACWEDLTGSLISHNNLSFLLLRVAADISGEGSVSDLVSRLAHGSPQKI